MSSHEEILRDYVRVLNNLLKLYNVEKTKWSQGHWERPSSLYRLYGILNNYSMGELVEPPTDEKVGVRGVRKKKLSYPDNILSCVYGESGGAMGDSGDPEYEQFKASESKANAAINRVLQHVSVSGEVPTNLLEKMTLEFIRNNKFDLTATMKTRLSQLEKMRSLGKMKYTPKKRRESRDRRKRRTKSTRRSTRRSTRKSSRKSRRSKRRSTRRSKQRGGLDPLCLSCVAGPSLMSMLGYGAVGAGGAVAGKKLYSKYKSNKSSSSIKRVGNKINIKRSEEYEMDDNGKKEKLKIKQNNNVLNVNGEKKEYRSVKEASQMYEKKIKKCLKNGFKKC